MQQPDSCDGIDPVLSNILYECIRSCNREIISYLRRKVYVGKKKQTHTFNNFILSDKENKVLAQQTMDDVILTSFYLPMKKTLPLPT